MKTAQVIYHYEKEGRWWADSPEVSGYIAGANTLEDLKRLVYEGIPFFVGEPVEITETFDDSCGQKTA
ncbi:MAG: hypothetical protein RDV48_19965 [Candidatus Eremiobacteraeota bacterium]|nr:hypothetical protein [Candidatus Eremiobacteraeota bacterium]